MTSQASHQVNVYELEVIVPAFAASSFDKNHPPLDPPPGCADRLMWQVARRLFADHQPGSDGWCGTCLPYSYYPCVARQLADVGLAAAVGTEDSPMVRMVNNAAYRRVW